MSRLKDKAIALRQQGRFYSEIASKLGVAKSTAYLWTHTLELSDKEADLIAARLGESKQAHIERLTASNRKLRQQRMAVVEAEAFAVIQQIGLSAAHKKLLCAVLFWCEGGKDVTAGVQFINSDPLMIRKFLSLFRESFPLQENKFRALVHLHDYHDPDKQMQYWSAITQIPLEQFHKPYLKPHTGKNVRDGYQGCVSVRYLDASLGKLLKMIYTVYSKSP